MNIFLSSSSLCSLTLTLIDKKNTLNLHLILTTTILFNSVQICILLGIEQGACHASIRFWDIHFPGEDAS